MPCLVLTVNDMPVSLSRQTRHASAVYVVMVDFGGLAGRFRHSQRRTLMAPWRHLSPGDVGETSFRVTWSLFAVVHSDEVGSTSQNTRLLPIKVKCHARPQLISQETVSYLPHLLFHSRISSRREPGRQLRLLLWPQLQSSPPPQVSIIASKATHGR